MDYSKHTKAKSKTGNPRFDSLSQRGAPKADAERKQATAALLARLKAAFEAKKKA